VAEKVRQTQNTQNRTKQETANLKKDTETKPEIDNGDKTALNRLNDQQNTLATQTRQLGGQMQDIEKRMEENRSENAELKDIAKDVKTTLNETAENQMTDAARKLAQAAEKADQRATRNEKGQLDPKKAERARPSAMMRFRTARRSSRRRQRIFRRPWTRWGIWARFEQLLQRFAMRWRSSRGCPSSCNRPGARHWQEAGGIDAGAKKKLDQIAAEQKKGGREDAEADRGSQ